MLRFLLTIFFITTLTYQCKEKESVTKKTKTIAVNSYKNALDIPLKKTGVIIQIDSLTFFGLSQINQDKASKKVLHSISTLNDKINFDSIITTKISSILNERKINYTIIKDFNFNEIPDGLITKKNIKSVDFTSIKKEYDYNDLIILKIKNGFDYKHDNPKNNNEFVAKTFLNLNILDLEKNSIKFAENIGGIRFLDESVDSINENHLEYIMGKSINETIEIIQKKY